MPKRTASWYRAARIGLAGALAMLVAGALVELWWLGPSNDSAFTRVENRVRADVAAMAGSLVTTAGTLAGDPGVGEGLGGDRDATRRLFELAASVARTDGTGTAMTVYDTTASARAWTGRPSEIPRDRILGDQTFFVAPGTHGLRLVYVEPVFEPDGGDAADRRRIGSVAAERVLSLTSGVSSTVTDTFLLDVSVAPVTLRTRYEGAGAQLGPRAFLVRGPDDQILLEATVAEEDLAGARIDLRRAFWRATLTLAALALLLITLPRMTRPRRGVSLRESMPGIMAVLAGLVAAFMLLRLASAPSPTRWSFFSPELYTSPALPDLLRSAADVLWVGLLAAGIAMLAAHLTDRWRVTRRSRRLPWQTRPGAYLTTQAAAGLWLALVLHAHQLLTSDTVAGSVVDLLHTSLRPWDSGRVGLLAGLVFVNVAAVWLAVVGIALAQTPWRRARRDMRATSVSLAAWFVPPLALTALTDLPAAPVLLLAAGSVLAALIAPDVRPRFRHASQALRLVALFLALLVPALLAYPTLVSHGQRSKQRFVEEQYARQAASHADELLAQLSAALDQVDQIVGLPAMTVELAPENPASTDTDLAFLLWRQTALARLRLTSAIELYSSNGTLVSRFALNYPEYAAATQPWQATGCDWEIFGEVSPFGSEQRRVLHAERAICTPTAATQPAGGVVVHVARDYQSLPFIVSSDPYVEVLRQTPSPVSAGRAGQDVELVIYGWGRYPIFTSESDAWPLDETLFEQIYASREPFWTTRAKGGRDYAVHVVNDRDAIYALGYPILGLFDHLVRLAELAALVGLLFVGLVALAAFGGALTPDRDRFGWALFREVRTSFYRRLFLAFVAVAVIPVLALAVVIRSYVTTQLREDVEAGAARTAAVAQRVIEESSFLQQTGAESIAVINDDLLIWISQIIDQDVNIFDGSQLLATSERDLFASGLLPTRTPDTVYHAIALQQLPSYVAEDSIGSLSYLVAAAPIRAAGDDAILTVPLTSRQQEIERQIADLDRGLLLGVTLFILVGAGSGFYMAERIADPVKRLTRATRQIARGDFDAQIAVRSADELQRLVASFNRMAIDLKEQQTKLERTHRLEAWAEMARQVAHEIKNPLTPVQLSAEHLLRVHADRGEPLSPVLQGCVESILAQVRILRQISAEFSSYASSPPVTPEPLTLDTLVEGVLEPYRVGLDGRVTITVDIPSSLPSLSLDRTLVGRALTNVVENALHAMPGGGHLTVRATHEPGAVILSITDTGVGLDEATLARIFEPYFSTRVTGTGLGMANAKRNIELNGGRIAVDSAPGDGTTVTVTFPLDTQSEG